MKKILITTILAGILTTGLSATTFAEDFSAGIEKAKMINEDLGIEISKSLKVGNFYGANGVLVGEDTKFYEDEFSKLTAKTNVGYNGSFIGDIGVEANYKILQNVSILAYSKIQTFKTDKTTSQTVQSTRDVYDTNGEFIETITENNSVSTDEFKRFTGKTVGIGFQILDPIQISSITNLALNVEGRIGTGVLGSDINLEKEISFVIPISYNLSIETKLTQKNIEKDNYKDKVESVETGFTYKF